MRCGSRLVSGRGEMAIAHWDHPSSRPTRTVHPTIPGRAPPPCWGSRPGVTEIGPEGHCRQIIAGLSNPRVPTPAASSFKAPSLPRRI